MIKDFQKENITLNNQHNQTPDARVEQHIDESQLFKVPQKQHKSWRPQDGTQQQSLRQVNDYVIFTRFVFGVGQYGKVCKAIKTDNSHETPSILKREQNDKGQHLRQKSDTRKLYACKIVEISNVRKSSLEGIVREANVHQKVNSQHAVRLYETIKTKSNIYMIMDLCNGGDLSSLIRLRGSLSITEARLIVKQLAQGVNDLWKIDLIHRDLKLANILLNFPDNPELVKMNKEQKKQFLKNVDLTAVNFDVKISDFGLSTILSDSDYGFLSICGTPLYSSPQILTEKPYSSKVDVWALGVILYQLITGTTPFQSSKMNELIRKITKGEYEVVLEKDKITVECALFIVQCLQSDENSRISSKHLTKHPFTDLNHKMTELSQESLNKEVRQITAQKEQKTQEKHALRETMESTKFSTMKEVSRVSQQANDITIIDLIEEGSSHSIVSPKKVTSDFQVYQEAFIFSTKDPDLLQALYNLVQYNMAEDAAKTGYGENPSQGMYKRRKFKNIKDVKGQYQHLLPSSSSDSRTSCSFLSKQKIDPTIISYRQKNQSKSHYQKKPISLQPPKLRAEEAENQQFDKEIERQVSLQKSGGSIARFFNFFLRCRPCTSCRTSTNINNNIQIDQ